MNELERTLAEAGHRLRRHKCGVWALGLEQFEDQQLPAGHQELVHEGPAQATWDRPAVNVQHTMHAGLGQMAEAPTQTVKRLKKAMTTLESIERFESGCGQVGRHPCNDAWKTSSGRRCQQCLVDVYPNLHGSGPSFPPAFGGQGIRVARLGFAAQATCWFAIDLHKAVMPNICGALRRLLLERHLEETFAQGAEADLLTAGVAVDDYLRILSAVREKFMRRVRGPRSSTFACSGD